MSRFAPAQTDLFGPAQSDLFAPAPPIAAEPGPAPLDELKALLGLLRAADHLPWPGAAATMAEERRALTLAASAGPEGKSLASAILEETERLFAAAEAAQSA